jgi:hypothetical protein
MKMPKNQRYDVVYHTHHVSIEPHFCREWEDEHGGCYGTNVYHGLTLDEACSIVADWYENRAKEWREKTTYEAMAYRDMMDDGA